MTQPARIRATQSGFDAFGPSRVEALSQFFTPPGVATRMVDMIGDVKLRTVLEPSCGLGALVKPMLLRGSGRYVSDSILDPLVITAVDIYEPNVTWCRDNIIADGPTTRVDWVLGDYLAMPAPTQRYDLSVSNVPYNKDPDDAVALDGKFLAKLMDECERAVTLIRLTSLAGEYRYEQVWSRCEGRDSEWIVREFVALPTRPNCGGKGGKIDFCVVKMSRRTEHDDGVTSCIGWLK